MIVTSPYVELDRGVAVEWRWVFTSIDEVDQPQLHPTDIEFIELVDPSGAVTDFIHPLDIPGCCCGGDINDHPDCDVIFLGQKKQPDCYIDHGLCDFQQCGCWKPGSCPVSLPSSDCCDWVGCDGGG